MLSRELKIIKEDVTIHYQEIRLGKTQKLVLVYIGVNTKEQLYIKRRVLTDGISKLLDYKKTKNLSRKISQSVRLLLKRGLVTKKGSYVGLTADGKDVARNVINHIKSEYDGKIDWKIIVEYYRRKEKNFARYIKGFIEIINKPYDTADSLCTDIKNFNIKKGTLVSIQVRVLHKRVDKKIELKIDKEGTKGQIKKIKSGKTKWKVFVNNITPELATEDNFKICNDLLKMFPEIPQKVEERKQELFKHYDMVREHHPNYPPLTEEEWKASGYPKAWKKIDDECNKLMKVQKNKEAFSNYLFEISHDKYPDVDEEVIWFAVNKYQDDVEKSKNYV